jgi:multisubunit Na+/H+ antiporter MnhE subunit
LGVLRQLVGVSLRVLGRLRRPMATVPGGSVTVDLDLERRRLTVHALDAIDDASVIDGIKSRYEARLKEIFAC